MFPWAFSIANNQEASIVTTLLTILASAGIVALILQRVRMAAIPAFLITGALIGPHTWGLVRASESLTEISHMAIILLLFGVGLNLHFSALKHTLARMLAAGAGSCVFSFLAGWPVAMSFGLSPPMALAVCMGLSLSSTTVVLKMISNRRELRHVHGRMALAILVLQDLIVLGMLAALPILAKWAASRGELFAAAPLAPEVSMSWFRFAIEGLLRVLAVALLIAVGRLALPRLMRESIRGGSVEVLSIVGIAVAFATAQLTYMLGFSLEMGAFLAGLLLSGTPFRHQLTGQIGPLRDLFTAVFFTTVGMKVDPAILIQFWWVALLGAAVMIVLKSVSIAGFCWGIGVTSGTAIAVGFSLCQASEFSLVLFEAASGEGLLDDTAMAVAVAVVVLSLILTPIIDRLGLRIRHSRWAAGHAPWVKTTPFREETVESSDLAKHMIIAGYGPIGQLIAKRLDDKGIDYTVIELNPDTVRSQSKQGKKFVFGDVSNPEVLESAGIGHAVALILTLPDEQAAIRACEVARGCAPGIFIAARTIHVSRMSEAKASGADYVIVGELATAEAMLRVIMRRVKK